MNKPKLLREYILNALPDLPQDQDRLTIVADQGSMRSLMTGSFSFEMSYKLEILITECVIEPEIIALVLFTWIQQHQSELMTNHEKSKQAITFESEIIDNTKSDIYFSIPLTERIIVKKNDDGKLELSYPEEPQYTEFLPMTNFEVIKNGEVLASWQSVEKQGWSLDMPFPGKNP